MIMTVEEILKTNSSGAYVDTDHESSKRHAHKSDGNGFVSKTKNLFMRNKLSKPFLTSSDEDLVERPSSSWRNVETSKFAPIPGTTESPNVRPLLSKPVPRNDKYNGPPNLSLRSAALRSQDRTRNEHNRNHEILPDVPTNSISTPHTTIPQVESLVKKVKESRGGFFESIEAMAKVCAQPGYEKQWEMYIKAYKKGNYNLSNPLLAPPRRPELDFFCAPSPPTEPLRLQSVTTCFDLLSSPSVQLTQNLRKLVRYASVICETSRAYISLIKASDEVCIASHEHSAKITSRFLSMGAHVLLTPQVMVILDTMKDWRFASKKPTFGRFYSAAPIVDRDGLTIGVIAVSDDQPKTNFTLNQQRALGDLSRLVMSEMENAHENKIERKSLMSSAIADAYEEDTSQQSISSYAPRISHARLLAFVEEEVARRSRTEEINLQTITELISPTSSYGSYSSPRDSQHRFNSVDTTRSSIETSIDAHQKFSQSLEDANTIVECSDGLDPHNQSEIQHDLIQLEASTYSKSNVHVARHDSTSSISSQSDTSRDDRTDTTTLRNESIYHPHFIDPSGKPHFNLTSFRSSTSQQRQAVASNKTTTTTTLNSHSTYTYDNDSRASVNSKANHHHSMRWSDSDQTQCGKPQPLCIKVPDGRELPRAGANKVISVVRRRSSCLDTSSLQSLPSSSSSRTQSTCTSTSPITPRDFTPLSLNCIKSQHHPQESFSSSIISPSYEIACQPDYPESDPGSCPLRAQLALDFERTNTAMNRLDSKERDENSKNVYPPPLSPTPRPAPSPATDYIASNICPSIPTTLVKDDHAPFDISNYHSYTEQHYKGLSEHPELMTWIKLFISLPFHDCAYFLNLEAPGKSLTGADVSVAQILAKENLHKEYRPKSLTDYLKALQTNKEATYIDNPGKHCGLYGYRFGMLIPITRNGVPMPMRANTLEPLITINNDQSHGKSAELAKTHNEIRHIRSQRQHYMDKCQGGIVLCIFTKSSNFETFSNSRTEQYLLQQVEQIRTTIATHTRNLNQTV